MEEEEKKHLSIIKKIIIFIILFIALFYIYIRFIEPSLITVKEEAIKSDLIPESFNGFKIVEFADIHYGTSINDKNISKVVDKINSLNANVVIFNGDLFDDLINYNEENYNILRDNLKKIKSSLAKFYCLGDEDYKNIDKYESIMSEAGFKLLNNDSMNIYYKDTKPISFSGTPSVIKDEVDITFEDNDIFKILISHEPTVIDKLEKGKPNVIFSAHSLGGLAYIPFKGYLLKQNGVNEYNSNFSKENTLIYINKGLGTHKYNVRFLNKPTINMYRLYNTSSLENR